jgi:hypothetical protein
MRLLLVLMPLLDTLLLLSMGRRGLIPQQHRIRRVSHTLPRRRLAMATAPFPAIEMKVRWRRNQVIPLAHRRRTALNTALDRPIPGRNRGKAVGAMGNKMANI